MSFIPISVFNALIVGVSNRVSSYLFDFLFLEDFLQQRETNIKSVHQPIYCQEVK